MKPGVITPDREDEHDEPTATDPVLTSFRIYYHRARWKYRITRGGDSFDTAILNQNCDVS